MTTRVPSLKALRAFEAAARHGSMKDAADELYVTAGAISRQIQALEAELGVMLFQRVTRGLRLTTAGRDYADSLTTLLAALGEATARVSAKQARGELRVLAPERFAALLVEILKGFEAYHPGVALAISTYQGMDAAPEFQANGGELSIVWGSGDWPGLVSHCLCPQPYLVPLCAPDYLGTHEPLDDVSALSRYAWLANRYYPQAWSHWLECAGAPGVQPRKILEFDNAQMLIAAARSGLGIVMWTGSRTVREESVRRGELGFAHPFHALSHPYTYYLAYPEDAADDPVVESFRDCVLQAFGLLE